MSLRHQRRRRVLADDIPSAGDEDDLPIRLAADPGCDADHSRAAYAPAARRRHAAGEPLVPTGLLTIAMWIVAGLAAVGMIESLHVWSESLAAVFTPEDVAALNLDGTRNLSHWFSATLLVGAGVLATFIYSLRRHRFDDYHGRYRVWIWMAIVALAASGVETSDVARLAHAVCRRAAELCALNDAIVWPVTVGGLLAAIGLRLLVEVRRSTLAMAALVLSAASFLGGAAVEWTGLREVSQSSALLVARGAWLAGYVFMLATFLLFARHVVLEIQGVVAHTTPPYKRGKSKARDPVAETLRSDQAERPRKMTGYGRTDLDPIETSDLATPLSLTGGKGAGPSEPANDQAALRSLSCAERRRLRRDAKMAS